MEPIKSQFEAFLKHKMPEAAKIVVNSVARLSGGASRETSIMQVAWEQAGEARQRGMVVRREQQSLVADSRREAEYRVNEAFFKAGLPVPETLFLERDSRWLDKPFTVTAEVSNCSIAPAGHPDPFGPNAGKIGEQFYTILGNIAAQDPAQLGLLDVMESVAPAETWKRELDYWSKVVDENSFEPEPIVLAAIRWLKRNPPPPAQKISIVHGDYRGANILYNTQGEIKAILDLEMTHLGDPLEDLAWAFDPLWAPTCPERPGSMIEKDKAVSFWEKASGLKVDPAALRWWELFSHVKGMAIWISARKAYFSGANNDPVLVGAAWSTSQLHMRVIADKLLGLFEERA